MLFVAVDDEGEVFGEGGGDKAGGARGWWVGVGGWSGRCWWAASEVHDLVLTALPVADGDALAAARAGARGGVVVVVRSVVRVRGGHDW
jgi:hypothetical protein